MRLSQNRAHNHARCFFFPLNQVYSVSVTRTAASAAASGASYEDRRTDKEDRLSSSPASTITSSSSSSSSSSPAASLSSSSAVTETFPVMCKYVRREIRELTSGDRAAYLSAVELFHRLDLDAGRRTYGHKWTNAKTSVVKHLARMTLDGCTVRAWVRA